MSQRPNRIRILPDSLVNVIAAGEVVDRPASVVKELVENALDAGASRITVRLGDGGRALIQVQDDGQGMSRDDALLAVERHATSKIASIEDLANVSTLGFRGEALPSIAAVGRFVLESWDGAEQVGVRIVMDFGKLVSADPHSRARGTTVSLTGIFSRLPARRKFLRSRDTERAWCLRVVEDAALTRTDVHFEVVDEGGTILLFPPVSDLKERLTVLWGGETARNLLALRGEGQGVHVEGYISPPSETYSRRLRHHVHLNGRPVRDPIVNRLIGEALSASYPSGRHPALVISVELQPDLVDANVHPSKREIRLRYPQELAATLRSAVKGMARESVGVSRVEEGNDQPVSAKAAEGGWSSGYLPRVSGEGGGLWAETDLPLPRADWRLLGQVLGTYIVAASGDGLVIVDQHAAHERILYNRLMASFESGPRPSQSLLEAVLVPLSPAEAANLQGRLDLLRRFGFEIDEFGGGEVRLSGIPAEVPGSDAEALVRLLASDLEGIDGTPEDLALMISRWACHASVRAGRSMAAGEMVVLLRQLQEAESGFACPHGRPTTVLLDQPSLEKLFSRR